MIINADLVDCIVAMPTQLFYTTQIPVSLWFLAKNKKQKGKTLFIDARKLGTMVTRKLRELTDEDIKKIADTYNAYFIVKSILRLSGSGTTVIKVGFLSTKEVPLLRSVALPPPLQKWDMKRHFLLMEKL